MPHDTKDDNIDIEFSKGFFVQNRYEEVLDKELKKLDTKNLTQMVNYFEYVLDLDDPYITLYLINKVKPECRYVTNKILHLFTKFMTNYNTKCEYKIINAKKIVKLLILNNLSETVTIDVLIPNFCDLDFDQNDVEYLKDVFGYTQIYKHYKETMNDIFRKPKSYRYMGLLFKMLDNTKLVYNSLLPIFERLTAHVTDNFVDANILQSVEILKGIIAYEPKVIEGKMDYVVSISTFLVKIYENPHNFRFLTYIDCNKILKGIKIMAYHCKTYPKILNLSTGIFKNTYNALKELMDRKTTVFEEFVSITCLLKILYVYYEISHEMGSRAYNYDEIFDYLQRIAKKEPKGVPENEWRMINNKFTLRKYKLLCLLHPMIETAKFDYKTYNENIHNCENVNKLFAKTNRFITYINWEALMTVATKKEKLICFFDIVHNKTLLDNDYKLWLQNVQTYANSLLKHSNYDLILFSVSKLTTLFTENDVSFELIKILLKYYVDTIYVTNDQRITKVRQKLQNFMFYHTKRESTELFLTEYIYQLENNNIQQFNVNIVVMFLILIRKTKFLDEKIRNDICRYFVTTLEYNDRNDTELSQIAKMYIASICEILYFQKSQIHFGHCDYVPSQKVFYKLIIALITCSFDIKNESYLDKCRSFLINFLFSANKQQKQFLGNLYKRCDENVCIENINLDEIFSLCMFLRKKYELL